MPKKKAAKKVGKTTVKKPVANKKTATVKATSSKATAKPKKKAGKKAEAAAQGTALPILKSKSVEPHEELEAIEPEIIEVTPEIDEAEVEAELAPEAEVEIVEPLEDSSALTTTDALTKYLAELRKYPLLTREEEERLAKLYYDTGDKTAAETLVTSNLRFVVKIAAEYSKFGAKLIDLIQEGNVGLMHAVKDFNPYKGVRLITYAVWWIRGYIQEYLMRQYSMVRIGTTANQRKLFYQLQKQKEELERMGFDQGVALLSGKLGIPEEEIKTMHQRLTGRDLSLDQPLTSEGGSLMDYQSETGDGDGVDDMLGRQEELHILEENIESIRKDLNPKELYLLDHRLLADEPKTLQEIGDHFGVTREAVRQMEVRVMKKLKDQMLKTP